MNSRCVIVCKVALCVLAVLAAGSRAMALDVTIERVTELSVGGDDNTVISGSFQDQLVSDDGQFTVFLSDSSSLIPGLTKSNGGNDVYLYDRVAQTTTLVSHASGTPLITGNGGCFSPAMSGDGKYIAFISDATNYGFTDSNGKSDCFLYDRVGDTLQLCSRSGASSTTPSNGNCGGGPQISGDGAYVIFSNSGTDLGFTDGNSQHDLFLFDRVAGTVALVSHKGGDTTTAGDIGLSGFEYSISKDGNYVAFQTGATDHGFTNANGLLGDLLLYKRSDGSFQLVSRSGASATTTADDFADSPVLSDDGAYVLFHSDATDYGFTDTNGVPDLFLFDRVAGTVQLVSHTSVSNTTTANQGADGVHFTFSGDGSTAAFYTKSTDMGFSDSNGGLDCVVFDRVSGNLSLASHSTLGNTTASNNICFGTVSVSQDGSRVAFTCSGTNLGFSDGNGQRDTFIYEPATHEVTLVSHKLNKATTTGDDDSQGANICLSADGKYVAFASSASDLVLGDDNGVQDVFLASLTGPPPIVAFGADVTEGLAPLNVQLQGTGTVTTDGSNIVTYHFDPGDGSGVSDVSAPTDTLDVTYTLPGIYSAKLSVTTDSGATSDPMPLVIVAGDDEVGDVDLEVLSMKVTVDHAKAAQGVQNDKLTLSGRFNPAGMPDDVSAAIVDLTVNDDSLDQLVLNSTNPAARIKKKLKPTGQFKVSVGGIRLGPTVGRRSDDTGTEPQTVKVGVSVSGVTIDTADSSSAIDTEFVSTPGKKASGNFSLAKRQLRNGVFQSEKTQAAEGKNLGYTVSAKGKAIAEFAVPADPNGDVTVTIGSLAPIVVPVEAFVITGATPETRSVKFSSKLADSSVTALLKSLVISNAKKSFSLVTQEVAGTGIPASTTGTLDFTLPFTLEVTTASGVLTYKTNVQLRRKAGSKKWKR